MLKNYIEIQQNTTNYGSLALEGNFKLFLVEAIKSLRDIEQ